MKKLLLLILVILSIAFGYSFAKGNILTRGNDVVPNILKEKVPILRFALVADSENDNDLLAGALEQAKGRGINFVVGLGDWSDVGTVDRLTAVKKVFAHSKLEYYLTPGDHDLWDSRNRGLDALANFKSIFGKPNTLISKNGVVIVLVDNSDIYKGILAEGWENLSIGLAKPTRLHFVMAHKTPVHPQSAHVMGEGSQEVSLQANKFVDILSQNKVDGFFSGDMHFFAKFKTDDGVVKITTIGAIAKEKNFQGPRYAIVTVYEDYTWEVEDVEIR